MRRYIINVFAVVALALGVAACSEYDDSAIRDRLDDLAERIDAAQEDLLKLNDDLQTYMGLVEALQGVSVITSVTESAGVVTITYDDGSSVTLASGAKGDKGDQGDKGEQGDKGDAGEFVMPLLKIDGADGFWYLSTDGGKTWTKVLDVDGDPVSGVGAAGDKGDKGDVGAVGSAPTLGIDDKGYWTVDYHDGKGVQSLLDANGKKIIADLSKLPTSLFASAEIYADGTMLVIEMLSGEMLSLPILDAFVFALDVAAEESFAAGEKRVFTLSQRGVENIAIERPEGWAVKVLEESVEVTAPNVAGGGEIVLYAVSDNSMLKVAAFAVAVTGGEGPVIPPATGKVDMTKLYGYGENTTGGEGATAANIHHFNDGDKFNEWLHLREKNKSTTPAIVWLSGTFTAENGRDNGSSPWFDIKRTSNITIYGTDDFRMQNVGFFINEAKNIIIRNVYIVMPKATNGADGISMQESENVWVDHCTFESVNQTKDYEDGSCDITHQTKGVTVSWCHYIKTQKSSLVGHSNSQSADVAITVTFHHNFFDLSSSRHPRVRFGTAHVYNNFYNGCTTYGVGSAYGAMVLVENNSFDGVVLPTDICTYPAKESGESNLQGSVAGYLYECNNEFLNRPAKARDPYPLTNVEYTSYGGSKLSTPLTYEDFKPDYSYEVDAASDIPTIVREGAGVGKMTGYASAPIAVDNGGLGTSEGGDSGDSGNTGGDEGGEEDLGVALANGWSLYDYNSASASAVATADGISITACGKFESGAQKFGFVYREVTGDFVITAEVTSFGSQKTSGNQSLSGLMMTPDFTQTATNFLHVMAAAAPASAYCYSKREAVQNAGRGTLTAPAVSTGANGVVRLERSGDKCLLSYSLDGGETFGEARSVTFEGGLPESVYVGLAVNSGDGSKTSTSSFANVILNGTEVGFTE